MIESLDWGQKNYPCLSSWANAYFCIYTIRKFNRCRYCLAFFTKFSIISLYLTKIYVTLSFAIVSLVKSDKIRQNFSNSVARVAGQTGWKSSNLFVFLLLRFCYKQFSVQLKVNMSVLFLKEKENIRLNHLNIFSNVQVRTNCVFS